MKERKEPNIVIYVPPDAKINLENKSQDTPLTKYNDRLKIFNMEAIKKLLGGIYGRN